jgi:hypothetical protein
VISVETFRKRSQPVCSLSFSTAWTHHPKPLVEPFDAVFPVVHTPYDCYERI